MKLVKQHTRAQIILSIVLAVSHFYTATAVVAPSVSRKPHAGSTDHQLYVPDHMLSNFSAVVALRAQKAVEENNRLAKIRNDSNTVAKGNVSREGKALRGSAAQKGASGAPELKVPNFVHADQGFNKTVGQGTAKVFFLFLTYAGANRIDLWEAFFAQAPKGQYQIFMHCQIASVCELKVATGGNRLGITVVPSVPSQYCTDLVSPMVQLLRNAIASSQNPNDKFAFVSETTLPVKPFADIYNTLARDQNSDFCFYHGAQWARLHSAQRGDNAVLLKHSQWVTLSKAHAQVMINRWGRVLGEQAAYWSVPMGKTKGHMANMNDFVSITRSINQCADEWAIFGTIFGAIIADGEQTVNFQGLNGSPIWIEGWQTQRRDQGSCRTFATWGWSSGFSSLNAAREIMADAPQSMLSCFPNCQGSSPAAIEAISDRGLSVLRQSTFLFGRKFASQTVTVDQFQRIILSGSPQAVKSNGGYGYGALA